jgi:hypothetical protein
MKPLSGQSQNPSPPQITGQPSVLYYAQQIFQRAGFASGAAAAEVSVLLGAFKLVMTVVAVLTVDRLGRRPLLLAGVAGMVAALLALASAQGGGEGGAAATVSVVALLVYVSCYQWWGGFRDSRKAAGCGGRLTGNPRARRAGARRQVAALLTASQPPARRRRRAQLLWPHLLAHRRR